MIDIVGNSQPSSRPGQLGPSVEVHLLGTIDFEAVLALQQRLVFESTGRSDGQVTLLLCEHPPLITVGRQGSWAHLRVGPRELEARRLEVRWVNRGGGCLVHGPGQLAVYPVVPLAHHRLSVGAYLERLHAAIIAALADVRIAGHTQPGRHGVWGRSGQLAFVGTAVKNWTTYFGACINVEPPLRSFQGVQTDPAGTSSPSSLVAERGRPVRMPTVRESVARHLAAALGCERLHVYTGHPLLTRPSLPAPEARARVG